MFAKTMILLGTSMMLPAAAYAATLTIVGSNAEAHACYRAAEAAEYAVPGLAALDTCNRQASRDYKQAQELKPGWALARQALARFSVS